VGGKEKWTIAAMAQVVISLNAANNIARIRSFYNDDIVGDRAIAAINSALRLLIKYPESGRPVKERPGMRERVIAFGTHGFVALYSIDMPKDEVVILSIRHQREAGYRETITPLDS
jgi:plasmid stabilization system protein ParE